MSPFRRFLPVGNKVPSLAVKHFVPVKHRRHSIVLGFHKVLVVAVAAIEVVAVVVVTKVVAVVADSNCYRRLAIVNNPRVNNES